MAVAAVISAIFDRGQTATLEDWSNTFIGHPCRLCSLHGLVIGVCNVFNIHKSPLQRSDYEQKIRVLATKRRGRFRQVMCSMRQRKGGVSRGKGTVMRDTVQGKRRYREPERPAAQRRGRGSRKGPHPPWGPKEHHRQASA